MGLEWESFWLWNDDRHVGNECVLGHKLGRYATANTTITTADTVNIGTATLNYGNAAIAAGNVSVNKVVFGAGQSTAVTLGTSANTMTFGGTAPTVTVNGTNSHTISSIIAGSAGLIKDGTGTLVPNNNGNTFSGGLVIRNGTVNVGAISGAVGTGPITMGGAGSAGATLIGNTTVSRALTVSTPDSGVVTLAPNTSGNSLTYSGAITLNGNLTVRAFFNTTTAGTGNTTITGGITGTGNLIIDNTGQNTAGTSKIVVSTAAVNPVGAITARGSNVGTGALTTISSVIGTNVTSFTKEGSTPVTLTGANTFTGNITVSAGTLTGAGATNSPGVSVFGARDNTRTITVNSGGTLQFNSGNVLGTAHTATTAPTLVINSGGTVTNGATATNNALNNVQINGGTLSATTGSAGYGAWNLNGNVTSTGASTISTTDAVNGRVMLKVAGTTNFEVTSGTLTASAPLIDNMNDLNTGALSKSGVGIMVLSGTNTYTGATTVTGGALVFSGTGSSNSSSGFIINGADAKLMQNSSVAATPAITLTQGTLTGSGTVGNVTVGNATGGVISNNDGVAGAALSTGALTFSGAATINTFGNAAVPIVASAIATNASGVVTLNASAASWAPGTYSLISYGGGGIAGAGFGQFALGTVTNASIRQSKVLADTGSAITLTIGADDMPYWVGDGDGKWNQASTNNWKLTSNSSYTTFLATDNVLFNDSASNAGPIAVEVDLANVAPTSTTFNNSTKDYVLSGAFGISSGGLTKSGAGRLTITNANSYTGNTLISGGVLDLSADGAQLYSGASPVAAVVTVSNGGVLVVRNFGQSNTTGTGAPSLGNLNNAGGQVVVDGGTLRFSNETTSRGRVINIGANGATLDVVNNTNYTWSTSPATSVPFTGSGQTLTLTGDASSSGTINLVIGGTNVSLLKSGAATWTLGGANTYTGNTTISAGTLSMSANRITTSPTILIGNGATWNSTGGLTLAAGQTVTGTGTTGSVTTTSSTGLITTSGTAISTSGTLSITRLSVLGTGNQITGGNIQSGGSATSQRGLLVGNGGSGDLTITGGTLTTSGGATNYDTIANTNGAGAPNATFTINGGAYVNTASSGRLMLGNTGTLAGNGTFALTSGSATINTLEYNLGTFAGNTGTVHLDGGTLTVSNIVSTSGTNRVFNFNGGLLRTSAGLTIPASLTANVKNGGVNIDTNGFSSTVAASLLNNGTGGLIKSGLGTLTLSGVNTYVGGTSVTGGALRFSTAAAAATDVTVAGGAEAGALVAVENGQWINAGSLTLQNNGVALVDYGSTPVSTGVAPISVANFLNGTTPGVNIAGAAVSALTAGQTLPIITWSGTGPVDGSAFSLRTHRLSGTFSVASNTLSLTITSNGIGAISWNTGNGNWDTGATNWSDVNGATTAYVDPLDAVIFGDASGASGNPVVSLATGVSPLAVSMNTSARNYTVTGVGSIGGSGALTLASTNVGTLTLATANNAFSGGTSILGGTLALGDATNTLPDTGTVTVDGAATVLSLGANSDTVGAVTLRNSGSITGSGTLTGSSYSVENGFVSANLGGVGSLTKSTTGTLTLSGANTFTGATSVNAGTLRLANTAALGGTSGISLANANITIEFDTDSAFTTLAPMTGGSGFTHTIVSDRATLGAALNHELGTMNFGASTFNITQGSNVASGVAGITFTSATMTSGTAGTSVINPTTATLAIVGGVTSQGNNVARTLQLDGTGTGHSIGGVITQTVASALSLSKTNTSTWTLSGLSPVAASNYSGTTTLDNGTLVLTTTSPTLTGGLTIGAAAGSTTTVTFDISGVESSATFTGAALVRTNSATANTIVTASGKTLTLNGGLTLGYDVNGGSGQSDSRLTATGGGGMAINGTTITIGFDQASATNAAYWSKGILDVSALQSFSTDVTNFNIGVGSNSHSPGDVILSNTANTILATTLQVGNTGTNNGRGTSTLTLGTGTNVIKADTINIGRNKSSGPGVVTFVSQTAGSPGTLTITNKAGTGRANIDIANQATNATGGGAIGTLDLRGHAVAVSAGTLAIGSVASASNSGGPSGTLHFDAGTFDVNTLNMGIKSGASTGTARGTLNISGGSFTVNTAFTLGSHTGGGASAPTLSLTGGTLVCNADIVDAGGSTTSTITLNGGTLNMSNKSIGGVTPIDALNLQSGTLQNVAQINNGTGWTKSTTGTLVLAGTNAYTGAANVNAGMLSITGTLNPLSTLAVSGGTLSFSGAVSQTVAGLTVNAGASTVTNTNTGTGNVLSLGPITRNVGGIVNFANATAANNIIQTTTPNTNGILGPWAFVGQDLAMNDGSGNIVAYTGYSDVTRRNGSPALQVIADNASSNVRIIEGSGSAGNITLGSSITAINTLLQTDVGGASAASVAIGATETLRTGGVVITSSAGALTVGTTPNVGTLTAATEGGGVILTNNSSSNPMTINSAVADNVSASTLSKAGIGTVILSGSNTYTGQTTVTDGTLRLGGTSASSGVVVTNGTLQSAGNLSATTAVTLSGSSTLDLFGASQTVASLANVAGNILTNSSAGTHASTATTPGTPALTDAITITTGLAANSMPLLVSDGSTRKTQVVINNTNSNQTGFLTNNANTFSGGVVLAHSASVGTRLLLNGTNSGVVGTGPVIIGQANTDKAGLYFTAATAFPNDIVFNTALGTDRVGLRTDAAITLSGKITANLAPATFTSNAATAGSLTITGQVTGAAGLVLDITSLSAAATSFSVTLNNAGTPNNYAGDTVINLAAASAKSATLSIAAAEQIPHGAATGNVVINSNGTGIGTLNLGGFSETINGLNGNGVVEGGSGNPTFTVGGNNANGSFSGVIRNSSGTLSLVKTGTGTQTLSGANAYTGTTTVSQGTLAFVGGSMTSPITASAGASLSFDTSATTTSTSSLDISAGTIKITGTPSAASHTLFTAATGITGTPVLHAPVPGYVLKVVGNSLVLEQAGYGSWAALNGAGVNLNEDHDGDGVPNGVEYFLGGPSSNTTGFTALPGVTDTAGTLSVTWVMGSGYAGTYGTDFTVETSDTLSGVWTRENLGANVAVTGSSVKYTFPTPMSSKKFTRLKVTGP